MLLETEAQVDCGTLQRFHRVGSGACHALRWKSHSNRHTDSIHHSIGETCGVVIGDRCLIKNGDLSLRGVYGRATRIGMMCHLRLTAENCSALSTCDDVHLRWLPSTARLMFHAGSLGAEVPPTALPTYPSKRQVHVEHVSFHAGTLGNDSTSQGLLTPK
jgi:hypothetical protein